MARKTKTIVARSARTGRFITKGQAKRNPNTTVVHRYTKRKRK